VNSRLLKAAVEFNRGITLSNGRTNLVIPPVPEEHGGASYNIALGRWTSIEKGKR
jgi:hypothetical protein